MKKLKIGDNVFIKENLKDYDWYGLNRWVKEMKSGWQEISKINDDGSFHIKNDNHHYTIEMIDWDKTIPFSFECQFVGCKHDNVNNPKHYELEGLGIQVIDVMRSNLGQKGFKNYCKGNVIKYILRADKKNGLEDYKKAQKYLDWIILEEENGNK